MNYEYFSHDYRARNDLKLVGLAMKHGLKGIGAYWCIVEMLYENNGYIEISQCERIAFELRTEVDFIKSIIFDFKLFVKMKDSFFSPSVLKRLEFRKEKSLKASASAKVRWDNANALQSKSKRNASKVKESKVKENKKEFIAPQISDVISYFEENGYNRESAVKAFDYYNKFDWKDKNGKKVSDWKRKMYSVWFKDENKITERRFSKNGKMDITDWDEKRIEMYEKGCNGGYTERKEQ